MDLLSGFWKVGAKAKTMLNLEGKQEENNEKQSVEDATGPATVSEEEIKPKIDSEKESEEQTTAVAGSSPESEGPDSIRSSPATSPEAANKSPQIGEATEQSAEAPAANVDLKDVSHKAVESAKSIGSFLFAVANKAGRTVSETAKHLKHTVEENSILADFNKEQEAFVSSKQGNHKEVGVAPWIGCIEEETVKQQILSISMDKRNFLRSPPAGVQFPFNFDEMHPVATTMLQEDPQLEKMRFEVVPKLLFNVVEKRQSTQDDDEDIPDSPSHEFVSDAYQGGEISAEDLQQEMKQLGVSGGKAVQDEEWEKELQQELQDFEMVAGEGNTDDVEWESEIKEILEEDATKNVA
ncbi:synapse-associated protein 1-like [Centruroides sculpturatus]|uniref:synapse-associated protein 1-like n=1 Tax=Centruroides sculpturatus TaxID=218467 RepID=UPI000C6EF91E|nr:synapse-associated protein 1-like [Centruroides sculpturatus]